MSYIPCSANCRYQSDGLCGLQHAGSAGVCGERRGCLYYVPRITALRNARFHEAHPQYWIPESAADL